MGIPAHWTGSLATVSNYNIPEYANPQRGLTTRDDGHFFYGDFSEGFDFPKHKVRPHRHPYFEIFYFPAAQGQYLADFITYDLEGACLVVVSPGQIHGWPHGHLLKGHMLAFDETFLADHGQHEDLLIRPPLFYEPNSSSVLPLPENSLIPSRIQCIASEYGSDSCDTLTALRSLLSLLIIEAHRVNPHQAPTTSPASTRIYQQFLKLLGRDISEKHLPGDYAAALGVSTDYLSQCVRQNCGHGAGTLVRRRTTLEAKRLLAHSSLTIAEIAYQLNFKDPSYFSRFFKNQVGCLPNAFRSQAEGASSAS
ncbi:AraC family transcriptional regulator [Roseibacillus persicicus]|uniref:AraC family transcriptional regulator n=1 Tax=Roseibacillus persicicus TaxID=454148 RepID=A0A918WJR7_9BACT|nr:AraC family transcriptional regulator [Roseibacillus persicicus]